MNLSTGVQPQDLGPDVNTYNAAFSACENMLQAHTARSLLTEMQPQALQLDDITYNVAISACNKGHKPHRRCIGYMRCSSQASGLA